MPKIGESSVIPLKTYTIKVTNARGKVLHTGTYTDSGSIEVSVSAEELPRRNPLHEEALRLEDLRVDMIIECCNIHGKAPKKKWAKIIGEPLQSQEGYDWMVPVVTLSHNMGPLFFEDWSLSELGIIPYVLSNGACWSDQKYTLVVE